MRPLIGLLVLSFLAWGGAQVFTPLQESSPGQVSMAMGFLLLAAYMAGELLAPLSLPRITGYLLAGLFFGPGMLGIVSETSLGQLKVIDSLALTFIALSAGGELRLDELRSGRRLIASSLAFQIPVIFLVSSLLVFAAEPLFAFTRDLGLRERWVLAAVLGAIAVARSPASAIAIIKEARARGPFTETVLGLTVAVDILAIVLFALVVSAGEALLSQQGMDAGYVGALLLEIGASLALGVGLGLGLAAWLRRIRSHHLITIFILAIVVSELSRALSHMLDTRFGLDFHLEPMLICIATGFVVRNFSSQGRPFLDTIERGGPLVYTLFFALAGASLDLAVLRSAWTLALLLVLIRFGSIQLGSWLGARTGGGGPVFERYLGITFVTQAGVSLGLAKVVETRFPGWGAAVATLAVASISINQLVGPIFFKHALGKAGETGAQDRVTAADGATMSTTNPAEAER